MIIKPRCVFSKLNSFHKRNNGNIYNWAGILIPTNRYIAMADEPFGFSLARLKPANKETAKHKITEPMTNLDELKKIFEYSPATQASGKFWILISDGGPRGFKPNSLNGFMELKNKTRIGKIAKSANDINIIWFGIASLVLKLDTII